MLEKNYMCWDEDTVDSFAEAAGNSPLNPANLGKSLGGNPFRNAAEEQDNRFDDAIDQAKKLETTADTTTQGTSVSDTFGRDVSQTTFADAGAREASLEKSAAQSFAQQQKLVAQQEASIAGLGGIQQQGRNVLGDIAGGQAFALSPEEQQRIDAQRQANIDVSSGAINDLLNQRLAETESDAARRGLRGQAFSQLQTGAIGEAARNLGTQTTAANQIAANQALALPGQRVGVQAGVGGELANIQTQAQQQAIQNRQLLQSPAELLRAREERLASGTTQATKSGRDTTVNNATSNTVGTGQGVAELLAARAGQPGAGAAGNAGILSIAELGVKGGAAFAGG